MHLKFNTLNIPFKKMFNSNIIVYTIVLIIDFIMTIYLLESIRFNRVHNSTNLQK